MAYEEMFANLIRMVSKEPIPEDRHSGRQRQEGAAKRRRVLLGLDPTASKIFCSSTALAPSSIIGRLLDGAASELIAKSS